MDGENECYTSRKKLFLITGWFAKKLTRESFHKRGGTVISKYIQKNKIKSLLLKLEKLYLKFGNFLMNIYVSSKFIRINIFVTATRYTIWISQSWPLEVSGDEGSYKSHSRCYNVVIRNNYEIFRLNCFFKYSN